MVKIPNEYNDALANRAKIQKFYEQSLELFWSKEDNQFFIGIEADKKIAAEDIQEAFILEDNDRGEGLFDCVFAQGYNTNLYIFIPLDELKKYVWARRDDTQIKF